MLSQEWAEFIEGGVALILGCRDRNYLAEGARGVGAVVGSDRKTLTIYVQKDAALRILPLLEDTKQIALSAAQPTTYKAVQLKGSYLSHRDADDLDRIITERYRNLFISEVERAGVPGGTIRRMASWPAIAIDIEVNDLFIQTPGPRAGEKLS